MAILRLSFYQSLCQFHLCCTTCLKMKLKTLRCPKHFARCLSSKSTAARHSKTYFVSTPIFYVNGAPHIGHTQSCLYADVFARMQRMLGKNVLFSTGTDEHGLKVQQAAEASKKTAIQYCTEMSKTFEELFGKANVSFTHFVRTSGAEHREMVQAFWHKLDQNGNISKGKYEGWYSITEEAFVPTAQIKEISQGLTSKMVSLETGSPVEKMVEENYVFHLPKFQKDLVYWLSKDVIKPKVFADDLRRWINEGLTDLSISRPKSRLFWGIPVPDDDSQIIYVWLDALVNYLTVGSSDKKNLIWPADCHVIGKDILKFHAIYWPAFLIAAGYEPPKEIFCHSHWTVNYEKMSKSKGNVISPLSLMDKYGVDGFRYFLLKASVPHSDTNYSETKIHRVLNAELCDTLGNLLSRSCARALNPDQVFPPFHLEAFHSLLESNAQNLIETSSSLPETVPSQFMEGYFYRGLDSIMDCLRSTNAFMQFNKPWELARLNDRSSREKLSTILHIVLEVLRISGILLQPIIPKMSDQLLTKVGVPEADRSWRDLTPFLSYRNLPNKLEGQCLGADTLPLYERRKS